MGHGHGCRAPQRGGAPDRARLGASRREPWSGGVSRPELQARVVLASDAAARMASLRQLAAEYRTTMASGVTRTCLTPNYVNGISRTPCRVSAQRECEKGVGAL
jgi:hypothetical protein